MKSEIFNLIEENPVIIAIKNDDDLHTSLEYSGKVVFLLYGNICSISRNIKMLKDSGKTVIVHEDLISGLSADSISSRFIKENTLADGIITTRPNNIGEANKLGLFTVMRFFLVDSLSYMNMEKTLKHVKPNIVDILPGVMPKILKKVTSQIKIPVTAGGLISDKEDIYNAIQAGCIGISTTNHSIWDA